MAKSSTWAHFTWTGQLNYLQDIDKILILDLSCP